jgi:hypothetical protein
MTRDIPKIIFLSFCAILLGVLVGMAIKPAKADGYGPGQAGSYKDEAEYSYSHRPQRVNYGRRYVADCDPHLTKYECRRFREKMAERANGRTARKSRIVERRYERDYERPVRRKRYAETSYVRSDADYRGRRECKAPVMAEGDERGTRNRAEGSATNAWKRSVVNRWGVRYASLEKARGLDPDCNIIRTNRLGVKIWICSVSARPCRED